MMAAKSRRGESLPEIVASLGSQEPNRSHDHVLADPSSWPWLREAQGDRVVRHPWCRECGLVKGTTGGKPYDMGGLSNLLARLVDELEHDGRRVVKAQRRLVTKRLMALDAGDPFAWSRSDQHELLVGLVATVTGQRVETVHSFLHKALKQDARDRRRVSREATGMESDSSGRACDP
jgi:hypothetical protein